MKINGQEYPTKMGLNQSILYCEIRDINISQMNEEFKNFATGEYTGSEIRDLLWSALKDGARFNKTTFPYSNYDVGDWLEDLDPENITAFMLELSETLPDKKEVVVAKKKVVKK